MAKKVCIIGAGSSGITCAQVLASRGIEFACFEKGSQVGGNWRYENDNGMSSAYRTLHINTSRRQMAYAAYPMPEHYPDYPDHFQIAAYFDAFVDHFGLREHIRFRTEVLSVEPAGEGWEVTYEDEEGRHAEPFTEVMVANGHHWDPRWPEPPFPGSEEFEGEQIHAHFYREPDVLVGRRVLVLGIGNSATDIAVESSRVAEKTFLAMRRGAWIVPKYLAGKPTDEQTTGLMSRMPIKVQSAFMRASLLLAAGHPTRYGLPKPDHAPLHAHPTVSSDLLPRLGHGDIEVKPNISHFDGADVVFEDGSRERVDLVIYCTGYKITFPFLSESVVAPSDNRVDLYRKVVSPDNPGLFFIGLIQPLGAIMPLAEAQAEWVADLIEGTGELPSTTEMRAEISRDRLRMEKRYVASKRHTVQVDFEPYLRTIRRERRRSAARAGSG